MKFNFILTSLFILIVFMSQSFAQEQSVKKIMNNPESRLEVINYLLGNHSMMDFFMGKMLNNAYARKSMIKAVTGDDSIVGPMMHVLFAKANKDTTLFKVMYGIMAYNKRLMSMIQDRLKDSTIHKRMMKENVKRGKSK